MITKGGACNNAVKNLDHLLTVASQFTTQGKVLEVLEYGCGNVNDTFLVTMGHLPHIVSPEVPGEARFILQRLNTKVFRQPELVMRNLCTLSEHVDQRLPELPLRSGRRFEVPRVLLSQEGRDCVMDDAGSFWRALSFIDHAETFDIVKNEDHGREVGYALGLFHQLLSDLPAARLADTLPGFHVTPGYLRQFDEVLAAQGAPPSAEVAYCLRMIAEHRAWVPVLEEAKEQGRLKLRPIHGDPKVNNVMLDITTGKAVALVDLDTVKPGLVHYDIGDCLRSGCNPLGEETEAWEEVHFEPDLARAILAGYLPRARDFLTDHDYAYLYDAIRLLTFELGLRFLTDYLAGNVYFKARHREHNLARALVQLKLCDSIESQATAIQAIIQDLR